MSKVWTTKEGQRIPVNKMTGRHLHNAINHLVRRRDSITDQNFDHLDNSYPLDIADIYKAPYTKWIEIFEKELGNRECCCIVHPDEPLPPCPVHGDFSRMKKVYCACSAPSCDICHGD